jgi:glutamine amidotransferase
MIVIIDYEMGNLRSVLKAFKRINADAMISSKIEDIKNASKLVLPGVGHFGNGMNKLKKLNLVNILNEKVILQKTPILGICLGMQLFTKYSEEGDCEGLGWLDARTIKFNFNTSNSIYKIPHMGWNNIRPEKDCILYDGLEKDALFYFVHSFHVCTDKKDDISSTTEYNIRFISSIQKDNIYGTQFHPEKSHKNGLKILVNFAEKI